MDISSRIKSIVEPYEKKIRDLEDKLLQKDFEITVLKEKLFNAENNPSNFMNMGMNMGMGMGMEPPFMNINNMFNNNFQVEKENDIIKFEFKISDTNQKIELRCFTDDEFGYVQEKVLKNLNVTGEIKFTFNGKPINQKLTVSESGMNNGSVIDITSKGGIGGGRVSLKEIKKEKEFFSSSSSPFKINIVFKTTQGLNTNMSFDENITIGLAIKKYLEKLGKENFIHSIPKESCFLFNAQQLKPSDNIKLKDLFKGVYNPKIVVNDTKNIIGA